MPDIEKISKDDFTHAISVAEEKVDSELSKLKKKLEKKKITSREYVGERMNILKEFVDMRRELQGMIDDKVKSVITQKVSSKVVNVDEDTKIEDEG